MSPKSRAPAAPADRYAVLLRGINVGKAKRIAMADLRALLEELGYRDVRTLLNSGNVALTAPRATTAEAVASRIERAIATRLGVETRTTALSAAALDAAIAGNPLADVAHDPSRMMVAVLASADHVARIAPLASQSWAPDALAIGDRVAYAWCPAGILESRLLTALGKSLGDAVTTRNWSTMTKLREIVRA